MSEPRTRNLLIAQRLADALGLIPNPQDGFFGPPDAWCPPRDQWTRYDVVRVHIGCYHALVHLSLYDEGALYYAPDCAINLDGATTPTRVGLAQFMAHRHSSAFYATIERIDAVMDGAFLAGIRASTPANHVAQVFLDAYDAHRHTRVG